MHAQVLAIDDTDHWQSIEYVHESIEHLIIILCEALITEAEMLCALSRLMVAPQHVQLVRMVDLGTQEKKHALN